MSYDASGNVIGIVYPDGSSVSSELFDRDDGVRKTSLPRREISQNGALTTHWYDASGNEIRTSNADRVDSLNWYDQYGRAVETRAPNGARAIYAYDTRDDVISHTDALGGTTAWTYDSDAASPRRTLTVTCTNIRNASTR